MKMSFLKRLALSLGYSSVVESLPRMREALDSIPSAEIETGLCPAFSGSQTLHLAVGI